MFAVLPISTTYQLVGLLHVVAAIVAFGPLFLYPRLQSAGETATIASLHMKLVFPALVMLWVLGMGMAGIGKYDMAETKWMGGSIAIWLATMVVSWFLIKPSLTETGDSARSKLSAGVGITHILLIAALYLMIFKPGGSVFK
jgi:hypothetical protein